MNAIVRTKDQSTGAANNATNKLLSIVGEKSQTAQAELERLIGELQQLRQSVDDQGKQVQQQINEFASLGQSTLEFTKLVTDGASGAKTLAVRSEGDGYEVETPPITRAG
jgi:F0F1-type ATP synthase membrane subunit b/b'